MTENEAIKKLEPYLDGIDSDLTFMELFYKDVDRSEYLADRDAFTTAITALKEIQQYREIGTVEECREAVEKQEAERIEYETNAVFSNGFSHYRIGKCPICDNRYNSNDEINYCSKCGQKLDWSEEDE